MADIWDIGIFTDEELMAQGCDISKMKPYGRKFKGFTTYCERNKMKDDIIDRIQYISHSADNAYLILRKFCRNT